MWRKLIFHFFIACICVQQTVTQLSFEQQCLNAHNKYRKWHGVAPLKLDKSLTQFAQQWADELARNNQFKHRLNNKYGENLYAAFGSSSVSGHTAVNSWYNEIKYYNYNRPGYNTKTAHFTQVVWKSSKKLGCAIAKNGRNSYVVANYDPPGNYLNNFSANVLKQQ